VEDVDWGDPGSQESLQETKT
jgi:hypothetical protein